MSDDIRELSEADFGRAIPARLRRKLVNGKIASGSEVLALRTFVGLSQAEFAKAIGISVHTLHSWEQGRGTPDGSVVSLLRIAARRPGVLRKNLRSSA